ncbi:unnamed protein product, partial [Cuscuta epithymum]
MKRRLLRSIRISSPLLPLLRLLLTNLSPSLSLLVCVYIHTCVCVCAHFLVICGRITRNWLLVSAVKDLKSQPLVNQKLDVVRRIELDETRCCLTELSAARKLFTVCRFPFDELNYGHITSSFS